MKMVTAPAKTVKTPDSLTDEWYTPLSLIRSLGEFDTDPACGPLCQSPTANRRIGPEVNGLTAPWSGRVWLNPPFSEASKWLGRMIEHGNGVLLVFTRSDAKWFQTAIRAAGGVFMLHGRTQFTRPAGNVSRCPLGCSLIPFGEANHAAVKNSGLKGIWLEVPKQ